jgi:hypothetical protein
MQNIPNTPQHVTGISHPLVADMYLKKDFKGSEQQVLVIEARGRDFFEDNEGNGDNHEEHDDSDSYLVDLLADLENLKERAEERVGNFDRIDIRRS